MSAIDVSSSFVGHGGPGLGRGRGAAGSGADAAVVAPWLGDAASLGSSGPRRWRPAEFGRPGPRGPDRGPGPVGRRTFRCLRRPPGTARRGAARRFRVGNGDPGGPVGVDDGCAVQRRPEHLGRGGGRCVHLATVGQPPSCSRPPGRRLGASVSSAGGSSSSVRSSSIGPSSIAGRSERFIELARRTFRQQPRHGGHPGIEGSPDIVGGAVNGVAAGCGVGWTGAVAAAGVTPGCGSVDASKASASAASSRSDPYGGNVSGAGSRAAPPLRFGRPTARRRGLPRSMGPRRRRIGRARSMPWPAPPWSPHRGPPIRRQRRSGGLSDQEALEFARPGRRIQVGPHSHRGLDLILQSSKPAPPSPAVAWALRTAATTCRSSCCAGRVLLGEIIFGLLDRGNGFTPVVPATARWNYGARVLASNRSG